MSSVSGNRNWQYEPAMIALMLRYFNIKLNKKQVRRHYQATRTQRTQKRKKKTEERI